MLRTDLARGNAQALMPRRVRCISNGFSRERLPPYNGYHRFVKSESGLC